MAQVTNLSPYLATNKALVVLLDRRVEPMNPLLKRGEYEFWTVFDGKLRCIYESSLMPSKEAKLFSVNVPVNRNRGRFRVYLNLVQVGALGSRRSGSRRTWTGVPPPSPQGDGSEGNLPLNGGSSTSVTARRILRDAVRPPDTRWPRGGKGSNASPPRPSPEVFSVNQPSVFEQDFEGYSISNVDSPLTKSVRIWSGSRTPGFRRMKKRHYPINGHSVSIWRLGVDQLLENLYWRIFWINQWVPQWQLRHDRYTLHHSPPPEPFHNEKARSQAIRNLMGKTGGKIEANLAQDFAQIGQLTRMIDNTVGRVTGSMTQLRRGDLSGAAQSLFAGRSPRYRPRGGPSRGKDTANNWLELQYGWKPLLSDIHGAMKALAALNTAGASIRKVTAFGFTEVNEEVSVPRWFKPASSFATKMHIRTKSECRIGIRFKIDDHLVAFLAQTGFTNPINLAWEVLPFSFVADWFIPIGPWLETLSAWHGLVFYDGYETKFTRQEAFFAGSHFGGANDVAGYDENIEQCNYQREWIKLDRIRITSFPTMSFPSLGGGLNLVRTANAIALMRQLFK